MLDTINDNYDGLDDFYPDDEENGYADNFDNEFDDDGLKKRNSTSKKATDNTDDVTCEEIANKQIHESHGDVDYRELFVKIMEDYHSGNPTRKEKAMVDAINALNGIIFLIIRRRYSTYAPRYIADLVQEGKIGIIKGLEKYDPTRSMPSTFFHSYIKHEIQNFINENINKTTAHYSSNIRKINKAISHFEDQHMPYTTTDLSIRTRLSTESIDQAMSIKNHADEIHYDGCTEAYMTHTFQSAKMPSPEETLIEGEATSEIKKTLLETLTEDELHVTTYWYGLDGSVPMSCKRISKLLGLSVDQTKKMHISALRKLRSSNLKHLFADELGLDQMIIEEGDVPIINVERALIDADDLLMSGLNC